jgi:diguanylate cyclase (GGDEF)-like protein
LREVGLALAYFDIDNFKRDFNEPYTETVIDKVCLPKIMRAIEAHCFYHGLAYSEGGDEFIVLLPNTDKDHAIDFMDRLRIQLPELEFPLVASEVTVSIGVCHIEPNAPLTDAEVRQAANEAKKYAKKKGGKNCIVTYEGDEYTPEELVKVRPSLGG